MSGLAIDTSYLISKLGITQEKIDQQYANMTVDEIIKAEATSGNQAAIELANQILNDPEFVIQLFGLASPENKLAILSQMNEQQLKEYLPLMDKKDLLQGMYFFSQDKLMSMLEDIPPEQLVKTVFEMFSKEQVVQYMPEEQLDKFLTSTDIDKNKILKHMESIPNEYLAQMLESVTGEEVDEDSNTQDLVKQISQLNPLDFKNGITNLQPVAKQQLTLSLGKEHEEWFQLFDASAYTNMINTYKEKPDVVKAMHVIDQENIVKMTDELPEDLMATVITQMDTKQFAETLMTRQPDVLAKILAQAST
ncbi:MAG: hypothetical protein LKG27_02235 [Clostridiaceae bacterium]|jgi:Mg/Co/Ni transporter MgtE|nr:hypothetical protein [Clostridiaceae bacterium]